VSKEEFFQKLKERAKLGDPDDIYNLGVHYMNGHGTAKNTSAAVLLFSSIERGRDILENVSGTKVSIDKTCQNTPLRVEVIISIIHQMSGGRRIQHNTSHIIGDLVEVSNDILSPCDLAIIYQRLAAVEGVDKERSVSCKMIGFFLLEKLFDKRLIEGQGISFKGYDPKSQSFLFATKEKKEVKVTKGSYVVLNEGLQMRDKPESTIIDVDEKGSFRFTVTELEDMSRKAIPTHRVTVTSCGKAATAESQVMAKI